MLIAFIARRYALAIGWPWTWAADAWVEVGFMSFWWGAAVATALGVTWSLDGERRSADVTRSDAAQREAMELWKELEARTGRAPPPRSTFDGVELNLSGLAPGGHAEQARYFLRRAVDDEARGNWLVRRLARFRLLQPWFSREARMERQARRLRRDVAAADRRAARLRWQADKPGALLILAIVASIAFVGGIASFTWMSSTFSEWLLEDWLLALMGGFTVLSFPAALVGVLLASDRDRRSDLKRQAEAIDDEAELLEEQEERVTTKIEQGPDVRAGALSIEGDAANHGLSEVDAGRLSPPERER